MNETYRNLVKAIIELESERTKERIKERMENRKVVPYVRVGREEQLDKLDTMFAKGIIDEEEYVHIRRRLRGDRNV